MPSTVLIPPGGSTTHGLLGAYVSDETRSGTPVFTRFGAVIDRIWGPHFSTRSDDDSWVWVDGSLVVDNDGEHGLRVRSGQVQLVAGHSDSLRVEYVQRTFRAGMTFSWLEPVDALVRAAARLAASC